MNTLEMAKETVKVHKLLTRATAKEVFKSELLIAEALIAAEIVIRTVKDSLGADCCDWSDEYNLLDDFLKEHGESE